MAQFSKSQKVHLYYGYNIELTIDFLATNYLLKMNIRQGNICTFCNEHTETLTRLFWNCRLSQLFWNQLETYH